MNRNRLKLTFAAVCLIAAGVFTLSNLGIFDSTRRASPGSTPGATPAGGQSPAPSGGVLIPDKDI